MKKLNLTVALLCTLLLLATAPAAVASESIASSSHNEPNLVASIWGLIQAVFDEMVELLPPDVEENPTGSPDDETAVPPGGEEGGTEPVAEAFPWPDPNG